MVWFVLVFASTVVGQNSIPRLRDRRMARPVNADLVFLDCERAMHLRRAAAGKTTGCRRPLWFAKTRSSSSDDKRSIIAPGKGTHAAPAEAPRDGRSSLEVRARGSHRRVGPGRREEGDGTAVLATNAIRAPTG